MYASKKMSKAERQYSVIDQEALAIMFAVKRFRQYMMGRSFILMTDHKPLERIFGKNRDLARVTNNRLTRWALLLNEYDFEKGYTKGTNNCWRDMLSRLPITGKHQQKNN